MRTTILMMALTATFLGATAMAAEDMAQPRTEARATEVSKGIFQKENVAIRPQVGILAYTDSNANTSSRLAAGLTLDWNMANTFAGETLKDWYIGPSTGVIFSHLGNPTSNFFGSNPDVAVNQESANFLLVPINAKIGYNVYENFRLAVHGGGNLTYRSQTNAIVIGTDGAAATTLFPNVGADMEWGLGSVALGLRPDVTLGTEKAVFVGTMTVAIPLV